MLIFRYVFYGRHMSPAFVFTRNLKTFVLSISRQKSEWFKWVLSIA